MKATFELIQYNHNIPAKIELINGIISCLPHWHKEIELVFVFSGELTLTVKEQRHLLQKDDVFLINAKEIHQITGEAEYLSVHISFEFVKQFDISDGDFEFEIVKDSGAEYEIRSLLWQLSRTVSEQVYPELRQSSLIADLVHILYVECRREKKEAAFGNSRVNSRNAKLSMEYIEQHYREEILQTDVAEMLGLHPAYFSMYFKEATGIGFQDYITEVRLRHALDALINENMTIDNAAKAGGFPSKRNFIMRCKRAYNLTPLQLKKEKRK